MKVEFIASWGRHRKGDQIELNEDTARIWAARGWVKIMDDTDQKGMDAPPRDKALKKQQVRNK